MNKYPINKFNDKQSSFIAKKRIEAKTTYKIASNLDEILDKGKINYKNLDVTRYKEQEQKIRNKDLLNYCNIKLNEQLQDNIDRLLDDRRTEFLGSIVVSYKVVDQEWIDKINFYKDN